MKQNKKKMSDNEESCGGIKMKNFFLKEMKKTVILIKKNNEKN